MFRAMISGFVSTTPPTDVAVSVEAGAVVASVPPLASVVGATVSAGPVVGFVVPPEFLSLPHAAANNPPIDKMMTARVSGRLELILVLLTVSPFYW
jgi:hypothetical protein